MLSRSRGTALGLALISGLLVAGCGKPVATPPGSTPPGSTPVPSATVSAGPTPAGSATTSASTPPTTTATPVPTDGGTSSPDAESTVTDQASPGSSDETGTYGTGLTIAGSKLEFTRLRWYWGKDAQARCKELGIDPEGAWCEDYHFEDDGELVSTSLADDVQIKVLSKGAKLRPGTRAQLERAINKSIWPHFLIQLANGEAVAITQVYTP